jgi:hypothetical protein
MLHAMLPSRAGKAPQTGTQDNKSVQRPKSAAEEAAIPPRRVTKNPDFLQVHHDRWEKFSSRAKR